jgi:hypothetical protein
MLWALIALAFLEGCIAAALALIYCAKPSDALIGALTSIDAFAEIVLPYIMMAYCVNFTVAVSASWGQPVLSLYRPKAKKQRQIVAKSPDHGFIVSTP